VISSWTPKERETFRDLIEECEKREMFLDQASYSHQFLLAELERESQNFGQIMTKVEFILEDFKTQLDNLHESVMELYLTTMKNKGEV